MASEPRTPPGYLYRSDEYLDRNPGYHEDDAPWKAQQVLNMLRSQSFVPLDVHDVGCGAGRVAAELSESFPGVPVRGWDISPAGIERAAMLQPAHPSLSFELADFTTGETVADLVTCLDVFEHVEDYLGFLHRLCQRCHRAVFHIPLELNVSMAARPQRHLFVRDQVGHLHHFSAETAQATLVDAGFRIVASTLTPSGAAIPGTGRQRLTRIPRSLAFRVSPRLTARVLGGCSLLVFAGGAADRPA